VQKLFDEVAPAFADRPGGYTRIIRLSDYRIGDGADLVLLQLLGETAKPTGTPRRSAGLRRRRNERRSQFANRVLKARREEGKPAEAENAAPAAE
jgi:large subunit ribosomal protein L17